MLAKLEDKRLTVPDKWAVRTVPSAQLADIEVWQVSLNKGIVDMLDIAVAGDRVSVGRFVTLTCQLNRGWQKAAFIIPLPERSVDTPVYFSL
jgi:hypothetical protein